MGQALFKQRRLNSDGVYQSGNKSDGEKEANMGGLGTGVGVIRIYIKKSSLKTHFPGDPAPENLRWWYLRSLPNKVAKHLPPEFPGSGQLRPRQAGVPAPSPERFLICQVEPVQLESGSSCLEREWGHLLWRGKRGLFRYSQVSCSIWGRRVFSSPWSVGKAKIEGQGPV